MNITIIPIQNIALSFIPIILVLIIFYKWKMNWKGLTYAATRMLTQLLLIGYFLTFLFKQDSPLWTFLIVFSMLIISSWISLHSVKEKRKENLKFSLVALLFGAIPVLLLVTIIVIPGPSWFIPSFLIPLTGMVLSSAMNAIGVAAERYQSEIKSHDKQTSKKRAFNAALIPLINSFLAVGLVSLPGMMTGQILSGVDPLIAARYQIVVMTMLIGAGGLSSATYLHFISKKP